MATLWKQRKVDKNVVTIYNIMIIIMILKNHCNHVSIIYF
jgi:hypothetical protein